MLNSTDSPLLLDTHSWVWLLNGEQRLSGSEFVSEAEAASVDGRLYLCSVSLAEVAMLVSSGSLRLTVPVGVWLDEALQTPGLQVVEIDSSLAAEGAQLPGDFPGDAADRLIVAATRLSGGRLATADRRLLAYGDLGYVSVLALNEPAEEG